MGNDRITDQSLTVLECRLLQEIITTIEILTETLESTDETPLHKKIMGKLKQKALRGAAMETPSETRERLQQ
jgi:hypothetical protein